MTDQRSSGKSRNPQGHRVTIDHNATVALNSVVTGVVRQKQADRGFAIVRFGEHENCSALIALTECEVGDSTAKEAAFEALQIGTAVTGTIIRKEAGPPTRLRLSVRQYKQDQQARDRRSSAERDRTERASELAALQASAADAGVVGGRITSKESYGVFVQLTGKWRALLPAVEMPGDRNQRNARLDAFEVGDYVEGALTVKEEGGRTLLSISETKAESSKLQAEQRRKAVAEALRSKTFASLVPGLEFTGKVWFDLEGGVDGTDVGLILDFNGVHVWLPEKEIGTGIKRPALGDELKVRFVGFDAAHDDMPFVERAN